MTPDLRSDLSSLAEAFRKKADDGLPSLYPGSDLRWCAEQIELALARHAPTDPAELAPVPESERPTLQAPEPTT